MRKVNTELRRYRRLGRSGRFSLAGSESRVASGVSSEGLSTNGFSTNSFSDGEDLDDEEEDRYDLSIPEEEDEDFSGTESDLENSMFREDATLSPNAQAEKDGKHRLRDEKRLMLDLSKHQQLLVDSQKMNQSIRRCLGWTDELIREGQKALAYNVKVSDVEIGGRVLDPDEVGDEVAEAGGKGLLSPSTQLTEAEALGIYNLSLDDNKTGDTIGLGLEESILQGEPKETGEEPEER